MKDSSIPHSVGPTGDQKPPPTYALFLAVPVHTYMRDNEGTKETTIPKKQFNAEYLAEKATARRVSLATPVAQYHSCLFFLLFFFFVDCFVSRPRASEGASDSFP